MRAISFRYFVTYFIAYGLVVLLLNACGGNEVPSSRFAATRYTPIEYKPQSNAEIRDPCKDYNALKNPYFGDLHVHTSLSNDAYSFGVRATPEDAYRYAFGGGSITLPINKNDQKNTRQVAIDRPLDFMAVTDHAEFLGEQTLCSQSDEFASQYEFCGAFKEGEGRNRSLLAKIFSPFPSRDSELCGDDGEKCAAAILKPWAKIIEAAQRWNDTSSECLRTAFIGFEYSSHRLGSNLHRNVIFRGSTVTKRPISYIDAPREWQLWELLDQQCISGNNDCDALAIPHNSNISNGRMFATDYAGASSKAEQAARAELRMKVEPIIEIMQHKGDSECRNGLSGVLGGEDELCDFEKFENLAFTAITGEPDVGDCYSGPLADYVPHKGPNCLTRNSYVRYALIEGLKEAQRIGVNPFKFGISASTDTHNGTGGAVNERIFAGHLGWGDGSVERRVQYKSEIPGNASNSPGGLIGVWAEQNTRASLFDNMRKKEVFGTSGPRIKPRFFGSWGYDENLCQNPDLIAEAYAQGVPMGSDLPPKNSSAPVFIALAIGDPGTEALPGTPLQKLQVIKGWYDHQGQHHQRIYDVAGNVQSNNDDSNMATVNLNNCQPQDGESQDRGFNHLCGIWQDPDFNPQQRSVYYLRAVENPSCRYTTWQCLDIPEVDRPADCDNPSVPKTIQERAWSSPIWYTP